MKLENTIQAMQKLGGKVGKEGKAILKKKKKTTKRAKSSTTSSTRISEYNQYSFKSKF